MVCRVVCVSVCESVLNFLRLRTHVCMGSDDVPPEGWTRGRGELKAEKRGKRGGE